MAIMKHYSMICIAIAVFYSGLTFNVFVVNGQIVKPNEANSSPSQITAMKGSTVRLYWNYTYIGDGIHGGVFTTNFIEQIIGFNSTSQPTIQVLAKRIGQNGILTLQSSIPAYFKGRVEIIPANSTLVIHGLQYNDSSYQFLSTVKATIDSGAGPVLNTYTLKPIVGITVNGIPDFITQPPSTLDVTEQSNLQIRIEMDGNPKPSADFKWTHLPSSTPSSVPSVQLYPFWYTSTYSLNNIGGSYCGRILQTTIKSSIGSSPIVKSTNITVLLKLDKTFNLKAGKLVASKCVEVKWNKVESGACFVKYDVKLKDAFGNQLYNKIVYNIGELKMCNLSDIATIANVELMVSFKSTYKNIIAKVSETPITTPAPPTTRSTSKNGTKGNTPTSTGSVSTTATTSTQECKMLSSDEWKTRDSVLVTVVVISIIIIIILVVVILNLRRKPSSGKDQKQTSTSKQPEMHYMDLQARSNETESNYASLQGEYEEVGKKNPYYVNI